MESEGSLPFKTPLGFDAL